MNEKIKKICKEDLKLTDAEIEEIDIKLKEIQKRHLKEAEEIGL